MWRLRSDSKRQELLISQFIAVPKIKYSFSPPSSPPLVATVQKLAHPADFSYKVHGRVKCGPCVYRHCQMYSASTTTGMISKCLAIRGTLKGQTLSLFRLSSRNHKKNGNESAGKENLPKWQPKPPLSHDAINTLQLSLRGFPSSHKLSWAFTCVQDRFCGC